MYDFYDVRWWNVCFVTLFEYEKIWIWDNVVFLLKIEREFSGRENNELISFIWFPFVKLLYLGSETWLIKEAIVVEWVRNSNNAENVRGTLYFYRKLYDATLVWKLCFSNDCVSHLLAFIYGHFSPIEGHLSELLLKLETEIFYFYRWQMSVFWIYNQSR